MPSKALASVTGGCGYGICRLCLVQAVLLPAWESFGHCLGQASSRRQTCAVWEIRHAQSRCPWASSGGAETTIGRNDQCWNAFDVARRHGRRRPSVLNATLSSARSVKSGRESGFDDWQGMMSQTNPFRPEENSFMRKYEYGDRLRG